MKPMSDTDNLKIGSLYSIKYNQLEFSNVMVVFDFTDNNRRRIDQIVFKDTFLLLDTTRRAWHKVLTQSGRVGWIYSSPSNLVAAEKQD